MQVYSAILAASLSLLLVVQMVYGQAAMENMLPWTAGMLAFSLASILLEITLVEI